ncbi:hypothetical protein [Chitinophaga arvensicola]|uniref:Lipocalin-like domain-containing protein n=1 Tax=Chitinophaga arvensicola TaxID=29529 RepID=A0A1I0S9J5_9BACT|nr:hypothetical protein [Chitinophaga arvensicola]SEW52854.1 hypothetical protein SAMN04488122_5180 [Chitinophaga arvensicola]
MKLFFTSLLMLTLMAVSCKKDKFVPSADPLTGTWELTFSASIMGPASNHAPGNGNLLKFSAGNHFKRNYGTGTIGDSGIFHLSSDYPRYDKKNRVNLIRFGDAQSMSIFSIVQDTLFMSSYPYDINGNELMDGGEARYVRIKD